MASGNLRTGLHRLRRALASGGAGLTDGELLGRFVAARDEAAFEALVYRHGPMVLGLCRRVLGNAHDAEDAFQATFLILARKASSVIKRDSVGTWLYAVAQRTAQEARAALARRRARERQMAEVPHPQVLPAEPDDWRPILDRELARLPRKFREAVVLFYLEGWPLRDAASKLGVPLGTLSSRLAKARSLLAKRLSRTGLSLTSAALASVFSEGIAPAAVPPLLVSETVRVAAGQFSAVAPPVALLTKGVLKVMFMSKLKVALGMLLTVAVLGATGLAYRAGAQAPPTDTPRVEKPRSELEALRRENELLKLNLEVVLEKVRTQETELRALRPQSKTSPKPGVDLQWKKTEAARQEALDAYKKALEQKLSPDKNLDPNTALDVYKKALELKRGEKQKVPEEIERLEKLKEYDRLKGEALKRNELDRFMAIERQRLEYAKKQPPDAETIRAVEEALKRLVTAPKFEGQQRLAEALEQALRSLNAPQKPKP